MSQIKDLSRFDLSSQLREVFLSFARLRKLEKIRWLSILPASLLLFVVSLVSGLISLDLYAQNFCENKIGSVCYDANWYLIERCFVGFFACLYAFSIVPLNAFLAPRWKKQVGHLTFVVGALFALLSLVSIPNFWPIFSSCILVGLISLKILTHKLLE